MRRALAIVLLPLAFTVTASGSTPNARILFNQPAGSSLDLVEIDADATGYQNLTPGDQAFYTADQDGSWSPDGSQIAFTSHRDSNVSTEIYVMNADGSNQHRLTHDGPEGIQNVGGAVFDTSPAWGPGDTIAYIKDVASVDDVWLMRSDGSAQRRVTADGGRKSFLSWQPNGGRLVYADGGGIFFLVPGDPPVRVATGGEPTWSPHGSRIAYSAPDGIWTIGPDGQGPFHVTAMTAAQGPAWSPDGSRIAFVATRTFPELGTTRFGPPARQDIYTVRPDGSDLRRLTGPADSGYSDLPAGTTPTWWPDGSRLFYLSSRVLNEATTYELNVDGSCEGPFVTDPSRLFRPVWRPGSVPGLGPIRCADLRLKLVPARGPAALDREWQLQLVLDNDGNEIATPVRLELKTPEPVSVSNQNGSAAGCTGTPQDLVCMLDPVAPGTPRTAVFAVRSPKAGNFPITITASATQLDTDPTTNTLQSGFQVLPCTIVGTYFDDVLYGTPGPDRICGLPGRDEIYGGAGDDYIDSGNGSDIVTGGPGHDTIITRGGNDTIYARDGERDYIDCGSERDVAIVDRVDHVSHCETVVRPRR